MTGLVSVPIPSIVIRTKSPCPQAEIIRRHDPGARQQDDAVGKAVFAPEPVDQVFKATSHAGDAGFALVNPDCLRVRSSRRIPIEPRGGMAVASVMAGPRAQHES